MPGAGAIAVERADVDDGKAVHAAFLIVCGGRCGSEPARDSDLSVDINVECQSAIASRLAPTGFCVDSSVIWEFQPSYLRRSNSSTPVAHW
ncbi:hypothetical protein CF597_27840 [Pseudomonas sp. PSB1]|nr:hypothetical protein [Pseudomonas sp. PSB1]